MKTITKLLVAWVVVVGLTAPAALYTYTWNSGFDAGSGAIPDGNPTGWSDTRTLSGVADWIITDVNVRLEISGGYNGDLYGYLVHDSGFAVLLNRSGVTSGNNFGYGDTGFNITLGATGGTDIHNYGGNGGSQLVGGSWVEDGRAIDPASGGAAFDAANRTALLSSFTGDPNGSWTLFLADMAGGDTSTLVSWGLDIEAVPEPVTWALIGFANVFLLLATAKRLRKQASRFRARHRF